MYPLYFLVWYLTSFFIHHRTCRLQGFGKFRNHRFYSVENDKSQLPLSVSLKDSLLREIRAIRSFISGKSPSSPDFITEDYVKNQASRKNSILPGGNKMNFILKIKNFYFSQKSQRRSFQICQNIYHKKICICWLIAYQFILILHDYYTNSTVIGIVQAFRKRLSKFAPHVSLPVYFSRINPLTLQIIAS